jgi:hypothetical protein
MLEAATVDCLTTRKAARMSRLSLKRLRPGMVLSLPLFNGAGVLLLPRGTRLTEQHLERFTRWGVREATIEALDGGPPVGDPEAALDPELVQAIDRALDERFATGEGDEIMTEIKRIVRRMAIEEAADREQEAAGK